MLLLWCWFWALVGAAEHDRNVRERADRLVALRDEVRAIRKMAERGE